MADPVRVLSLGYGLQSSALLLMSGRGLLPKIDVAVFADTQYEPKPVYVFADWLKGEAARYGIRIIETTAGDIREDSLEFRQLRRSSDGKRYAAIPFFLKNPDGSQGRLTRQCTKEYKIWPVEQEIRREVLGLKKRARAPKVVAVEQWMGITTDEARRATPPGVWKKKTIQVKNLFEEYEPKVLKVWKPILWKTHTFPFLNLSLWPDRRNTNPRFVEPSEGWSRDRVRQWAEAEYPGVHFPRSACICCPFRTDEEWLWLKQNDPTGWADAVDYDLQLREREAKNVARATTTGKLRKDLTGDVYIHRSMIPLGLVNLEERLNGQGFVGGAGCTNPDDACEGMCGM